MNNVDDRILKAYNFAFKYHRGQKYGSYSYVYHLTQVVDLCEKAFRWDISCFPKEYWEYVIQVAWLHDAVEDTDCTVEIIRKVFGDIVANSVDCITRRDTEPHHDYLKRVMSNPISLFVKRMDTISNLTHSTFENNTKRIIKYTEQLKILSENDLLKMDYED